MILILIFIITTAIYLLHKIKHSYWDNVGVKGPVPLPIVGNFGRLMMQKQTVSQLIETTYKQFPKEKVVGLYCGFRPVLLLKDPEIINQVMTTDFNTFVNRGIRTADHGFSDNLLISENETWKAIRQKLSSAFTSIKLKQMIPLFNECVQKLLHDTDLEIDPGGNCDIKELATHFTLDLVCICGFGLDLKVDSNQIKEMNEIGKRVFTPPAYFRLWYVAEMLIPGIQDKFPFIDPTTKLRRFFMDLVDYVIKEREKAKARRHDFMDILIKMYKEETIKIKNDKGSRELNVDRNFIASQAFVFLTTGYETSSSALSFLLYELARHEDYQETAYKEICDVLHKHNGELTYDSVNEMNYLLNVYNETVRKYAIVGFIIRKAGKDYIIPGINVKIKAGTLLLVSVGALQKDTTYFKDGEVFNPMNCSPENLKKIPQCAYMPFGVGPRNCIGTRFSKLSVMMAAAAFLRKYKISPCTEKKPIEYDSISITLTTLNGIWVKVSKRN